MKSPTSERLEHEHEHTTGEICEAALQCQTDCQTGGTQDGDEGSGFDADHRGDADQQQRLESDRE